MTDKFKEMLKADRTKEEYLEDYASITNGAKKRGLNKSTIGFYTEIHHIVPRCMGGNDDPSNLVLLSMEEHIVAHLLLGFSYKDDLRLICAALAMINLNSQNRINQLSKDILEKYTDEAVRAKELYIKTKSIAVVCYSYSSFEVVKIYKSVRQVREDGLNERHVKECMDNTKRPGEKYYSAKSVKGYRFERLSSFEVSHPTEIDEYYKKLESGFSPTIVPIKYLAERSPNYKGAVSAVNDFDEVLKTFSSIEAASIVLGVSEESISSAIRRKSKLHGVYWDWENNIEDKEIKGNFDLAINKHKTRYLIVKYDLSSKRPIKLYNTNQEINEDGYCSRQVQEVVSGRLERYIKSGFGWSTFKNYISQFPEHIEELKKLYYL